MRKRRDFRMSGKPVEHDVDDEIESHLAHRIDQFISSGETPERARELALARFGDLERSRRELYGSAREKRGRLNRFAIIQGLRRDASLVWRQSRRAPGSTLMTLATLAIAIGLSTATFAVVDHVLLRKLPYAQPGRLVFFESMDSANKPIGVVSSDNWLDMQARNTTLESSAIYREFDAAVITPARSYRVPLELVTPQFFAVLQPPMLWGRGFSPSETTTSHVAVIAESFWDEIGRIRNFRVQGQTYEVVGVVRRGAEYPHFAQVWLPNSPRFIGGGARNNVSLEAIGRLRAGVTIDQARRDLSAIARQIEQSEPESRYTHGVAVQSLQTFQVRDVERYLQLLMGSVGFLLVVACANIAGMNFARARTRMPEVAVRMALGAGRTRVMLQLITEQVVISAAGGAIGVIVAFAAVRWIAVHTAGVLPRASEISVDGRIIAFAFIAALLTGVFAAIVPTWHAANTAPRALLGARGLVQGGSRTSGSIVVAVEVAAAIMLLAGGALLLRSFRSVISHELGFEPTGLVAAHVILDSPRYFAPERVPSFWDEFVQRAHAIQGVQSVALSNIIPTATAGPGFIEVEGIQDRNAGAGYRVVSAEYFQTMKIAVRAGRTFNETDRPGTNRGVVVNESMAKKYWPGQSPLGKRVKSLSFEGYGGRSPQWLSVIGVVSDIRQFGYEFPAEPEMYVSARDALSAMRGMFLTVRTNPGNESVVQHALETELRRLDPELAPDIASLSDRLDAELSQRKLILTVLGVFGILAVVLSAVGVYALLSFAVGQRTREIGVRIALGSRAIEIVSLIVSSVASVVGIGACAGLLAALTLTRVMESLLVDVKHTDPLSYLGAVVVIALAAFAAATVPVWRALRVDPVTALRAE